MKTLALASLLLLGACGARAATPAARTSFPTLRSEAKVMVADIDNRDIAASRAGKANTKVHLCVAPDGAVDQVDVIDSSGHTGYDRAVVQSARSWKFEAGAERSCTKMNVVYDAI
jgi:TonB family protein